jgi:microcystin-dependent protein
MEAMLGQVVLFPYPFTPRGWVPCDGQLLPIRENAALFSLLGTQYGGDGTTSFALPKLASIQAQDGSEVRYFIALMGIYPERS